MTRFEQLMRRSGYRGSAVAILNTRPDHLIADKGYDSNAISAYLRPRGITHTIPQRADHIANRQRKGSRGGRPPTFDKSIYIQRNVVERCVNQLKQCRSVATRYDKTES
jgi:transposase